MWHHVEKWNGASAATMYSDHLRPALERTWRKKSEYVVVEDGERSILRYPYNTVCHQLRFGAPSRRFPTLQFAFCVSPKAFVEKRGNCKVE